MCFETSAYKIQTPRDYAEESIEYSFCQNIILNSIKFKIVTILVREIKVLFLNRFISVYLDSVVDLVITLYIGVRETSMCL